MVSSPPQTALLGLQRVGLFEGLPPAELQAIGALCRWQRFDAGQQIISREAADDDVYFVVSGRVRITLFSAAGREVSFGEKRAGECFGDFAAIDGASRSADVVAIEESLVAALGSAAFRRLLKEQPAVAERMLVRLVASVRELTERVFDFSTLGVQNRLHAEVLRLARVAGVHDNAARIEPAPRHGEIASRISTYREQVTRELTLMAKDGLVRRDGTALVIDDVERLERLVAEVRRLA